MHNTDIHYSKNYLEWPLFSPSGWDEQRKKRFIAELDAHTDKEWIAAGEAAAADGADQAVVTVGKPRGATFDSSPLPLSPSKLNPARKQVRLVAKPSVRAARYGQSKAVAACRMASMPLTFALWSLEASGISFATMLLLYLQLFTSAFMGAAIGLVKPFHSAADQKSGQQQMAGWGCLTYLILMSFAGNLTRLPALLSGRETAVVGLFVPLGPLTGLFEQDNPWHYGLSFFGTNVPFLLLTPVVQLALAALCFVCMVRRLTNTMNPALTKPLAYLVLVIIDVLAAAVLFEPGPGDPELGPRSMHYWLWQGLASLVLVSAVTPDRELILTWIWRFRGRHSRLRDLCWQDRSPNLLVLVTTGAIGVTVYLLLVAVPALLVAGWNEARPGDPRVIYPLVLACVLTLSLGMLSQIGKFLAGRGGGWIVLLPVLVDLTAFWAGDYMHAPWLSQFSVVAHWRNLQSVREEPLSVLPVVCLHGLLFFWSWRVLQRNLRLETKKVQRKLRDMGVTPPAGPPW